MVFAVSSPSPLWFITRGTGEISLVLLTLTVVLGIANALLGANVMRAVELDINPEWVAAYLYGHRAGHWPLASVPIVPGQPGVPGQFLAPYSRDFFTIVAR
jgi:hypothetical protein